MDALEGIRIIDAATLFAGPLAAAILADLGAEVIKVEHPKGDPVRSHGYRKNGVPLWWKVISRNKKVITLDLSKPQGQEIMRRLVAGADVLIESFRPGTLERWGLGPDVLRKENPKLIYARVTGFGQIGPAKFRPGFGTLAEAMSGFAAMTATVATLGMLPAAIHTGVGSDVQRGIATVVVGGLAIATLLTLFVVPSMYHVIEHWAEERGGRPLWGK